MKILDKLRQTQQAIVSSLSVFVRDVGHGLLEVSHNSLAILGLVMVAALVFAAGRADLREEAEVIALDWLQSRHEDRTAANGADETRVGIADQDGVSRATAADPRELTSQQALVARWITRRYKVAPEPISRLVQEAWVIGQRAGLDPTLILAIMAVESSFNPFAQSPVGAQGLMQVMTRVHDAKYEAFGGTHAAFDPVSNLRVGVQVLKECIARAGNLHDGLRYYVGAGASEQARRRLMAATLAKCWPNRPRCVARLAAKGLRPRCQVPVSRRFRRPPLPASRWQCCDDGGPVRHHVKVIGAPCSIANSPLWPMSTPKSGPLCRPRIVARKSTSSSSLPRITRARQ